MGVVISLWARIAPERDPGLLSQLRRLGLMDWWENHVSIQEELPFDQMIAQVAGNPACEPRFVTDSAPSYLSFLSSRCSIDNPGLSDLLHKKAFQSVSRPGDYIDFHFDCSDCILNHYRRRSDPAHLDRSILWCQRMIEIASEVAWAFPVVYGDSALCSTGPHLGFHQLSVILEQQRRFQEAIDLSIKARESGWRDNIAGDPSDWDYRISRLRKKLAKMSET
ncbi:MAG: hypothetical protein KJ050_10575 [Candidatus Omnitrophica bacterium]|nr:hypothetical protein [Candidatus Omnitrophota bacterium]